MVRPMRRSVLLTVAVFCPHFNRTVEASLNDAIGRLVHCTAGDTCRPTGSGQPYPAGCPVYPSLAAQVGAAR
jgi:hypothetical protein